MSLNNIAAARAMEKLFEIGELPPHQAVFFKEKPAEELYDIENDPYEMNNLADNPKHKQTLHEMQAALDQWIIETNDEGRLQEDPEDVEEMEQLGIFEVTEEEFALCEYICPSKTEVQQIIRDGLDLIEREG